MIGALTWVIVGPALSRSWGYAEREDDLLVRRGVMFSRLSVVPYGRMQFIDVQAGPLERLFPPRDSSLAHGGCRRGRAHPRPRERGSGPIARPPGRARRGAGGRPVSTEAPEVWHRLHPVSPVVRGGRVTIGPRDLALPERLRPGPAERRDTPAGGRRDPSARRLRLVARDALADRRGRPADRDRAPTAQVAPVSARAGSGDRRRPAGAGPAVPGRRAAPADGRGERRDGATRLRRRSTR